MFNDTVEGVLNDNIDAVLALIDDRTRLLGLAEPLHAQQHIPLLRNALFAALVERRGFRSIAVESCCLRGGRLDALLSRGVVPDDEQVADGFSHGFGEGRANRELAAWIATYNRGRAPGDRVRFAGFDAPMETFGADSPRAGIDPLHRFLRSRGATGLPSWEALDALLGPDEPWSNPAVIMDPSRGIGTGPEADELAVVAGELAWRHATTTPDGPDDDVWWDAATAARSATGLLTYHRLLAAHGPDRSQRAIAHRDAMMAANLTAVVERERRRGPTLVFAHHGHLQYGPSSMTLDVPVTWDGAGSLLATRLGPEYSLITTMIGSAPGRGIGAPGPGTVEHALLAAHPDGAVLPAAHALEPARGASTRDPGPWQAGYCGASERTFGEADVVWLVPALTS